MDRIPPGCCGDDCNKCPRYMGTLINNSRALGRVAEIWFRMGWRDRILPPDELRCNGCISVKSCAYGIKECCSEKKIDNCGYCDGMPCDRLKKMFAGAEGARKIIKALLEDEIIKKEECEMLNKAFWIKEERLRRIWNDRKKR